MDVEQPDGEGNRVLAMRTYYIFQWLVINRLYGPNLVKDGYHTHPSDVFSTVIRGGYIQDILENDAVKQEKINFFNIMSRDCYHNIVSVKPNTWTIFMMNPFRMTNKIKIFLRGNYYEKKLKE